MRVIISKDDCWPLSRNESTRTGEPDTSWARRERDERERRRRQSGGERERTTRLPSIIHSPVWYDNYLCRRTKVTNYRTDKNQWLGIYYSILWREGIHIPWGPMIKGILIINNQGKPRLVKFYKSVVSKHGAYNDFIYLKSFFIL